MRLLHFSDAHLDVPHSISDLDSAEVRRAELRSAFSSMMLYIRQNDVRLVLCSGDLFDHAFLTRETTALLRSEFASVPDCHFIIAPGNRDFYAPDSAYSKTVFSNNVHIFTSPRPMCFPLDDIGVQVWGFAHVSPDMGEYAPLERLKLAPKQEGILRIFCGHAMLCEEGNSELPCEMAESGTPPRVTKEQLAACGFDYAALGYAHNTDGTRRVRGKNGGWTYFGYAGCLIGRGFDECGIKGAVCGTFEVQPAEPGTQAAAQTRFSVRRLRITRRHYEVLHVDFTGSDAKTREDAFRVILQAKAAAEAAGTVFDADACVRVLLSGALIPTVCISTEDLQTILAVHSVERYDDISVMQDPALSSDITLRGAYYRALLPLYDGADADMRAVADEAMRLGLYILENEK